MIRILLLGTPEISVPIFDALLNDKRFQVCGMVCQPDRPVGRKQISTPPPTKLLAQKYHIPVFQPQNPKDPEFLKVMASMKLDVAFVCAYGHIVRQEFLDIPKFGCVNLHVSLLPQLRGSSPIQSAILHGFSQTGITYILMDVGMDTGPILETFGGVDITGKNVMEVNKLLSDLGASTASDVLSSYTHGDMSPRFQEKIHVSYCRQIRKEDGHINPALLPASLILSSWRAFREWPGIYSFWNGERLQFLEVEATDISSEHPGQLSSYENNLYIEAMDYKIKVLEIRKEGKNVQSSLSFIKSYFQTSSFLV